MNLSNNKRKASPAACVELETKKKDEERGQVASTAQGVGVAGTDHTSATTKCHLSEMNCKKKDTEGERKGGTNRKTKQTFCC